MSNAEKLKFVLRDPKKAHVVRWPVSWRAAGKDGEPELVGFTAQFKLLPADDVDTWFGGKGGFFGGGRFTDAAQNRLGMAEVLVNWSGVELEDEDKNSVEVPFSVEMRDMLLAWDDCLVALVHAYNACLAGHHAKN